MLLSGGLLSKPLCRRAANDIYPRTRPMCNHQLVMELKAIFSPLIYAGANENLFLFTEEREVKVFRMGKGDNTMFSRTFWQNYPLFH